MRAPAADEESGAGAEGQLLEETATDRSQAPEAHHGANDQYNFLDMPYGAGRFFVQCKSSFSHNPCLVGQWWPRHWSRA